VEVTFLGTGTSQGVPVIACECEVCKSNNPRDNRTRSSVMVREGNTTIIIDAGPDFRQQMLREKVKGIDAILITHEHKDHVAGLDDIRPFNFIKNNHIDIFCEKAVDETIRREFAYVFTGQKYPGIPKMRISLIDDSPFFIQDVKVTPIRVMHMDLPIFGYRIGDFVYITDASFIPESEYSKLTDVNVLVVNALRKRKHYSHFNLEQALQEVEKIKPKKAFLTHVSHQIGLYEYESKTLPSNVSYAYDGMKLSL